MSAINSYDYFDLVFPGGHSDLLNYTLDEDGKDYPAYMFTSNFNTIQVGIISPIKQPSPDSLQNNTPSTLEITSEPTTIVSMSTAFNASSDFGDGTPDMTLISKDAVHFYVRRDRLLSASDSSFDHLLPSLPSGADQPSLLLEEDANTLNIVLHNIYNIPFRHYSPSLEVFLEAIKTLKKYGISLESRLAPGSPLYEELVGKIPFAPIEVYAIAAENSQFPLASEASAYLLSYPLVSISEEMATRIGPVYLLMLFTLQTQRLHVLQCLVTLPPREHEPTLMCGWTDFQCLKTAWSLACASFIFNATAGSYATFVPNSLLNEQ